MAWLEWEDHHYGSPWRFTLVDGKADAEKVAEAHLQLHRESEDAMDTANNVHEIVELARLEAHRDFSRRGKLPPAYPYCDLFILQAVQPPSDESGCAPEAAGLLEPPVAGRIYLLQVDAHCPHYRHCLKAAMEAIGMEGTLESEHGDLASYKERFEAMADELLEPYIAPISIAEERIRRRGYDCDGEGV